MLRTNESVVFGKVLVLSIPNGCQTVGLAFFKYSLAGNMFGKIPDHCRTL